MRALLPLLAVAGCIHAPTLKPAQLERLEKSGRVAFVVAPRGWDRAEMFTLVGGWMAPHSCVTCTPQVSSDTLVTVAYPEAHPFLTPLGPNLRSVGLTHGARAASNALGISVMSSGSELLDELAASATWHRYPYVGGVTSLDTASTPESEVLGALAKEGVSTLLVMAIRDVTLKPEHNSLGVLLDLRVYDTATGKLLHFGTPPVGFDLERDLSPEVMAELAPDVEGADGLSADALARRHHRLFAPSPDAVAALEEALGGIFEDFLAEELGRIASASL